MTNNKPASGNKQPEDDFFAKKKDAMPDTDSISAKVGEFIDLSDLGSDDADPEPAEPMTKPIVLGTTSTRSALGAYDPEVIGDIVTVLFPKAGMQKRLWQKRQRYMERVEGKDINGGNLLRERCLIAIIDALISEGMAVKVDVLVKLKSAYLKNGEENAFDEAVFDSAYREMIRYCDLYIPSEAQLKARAASGTPTFGLTAEEREDKHKTKDLTNDRLIRTPYQTYEEPEPELDFHGTTFRQAAEELADAFADDEPPSLLDLWNMPDEDDDKE